MRASAFGIHVGRFSHCGPKNGGRFAYMEGGKLRIGLTHKPMTKIARKAFMSIPKKGWKFA